MDAELDTVVIGAGVVGLAIARELGLAGHEVVVVEAEATFGCHASSRNSEVIHAGLYYAPGSAKARLCREGRERLLHYCQARGVPHQMVGKLIVATCDHERQVLETLQANAAACAAPPVYPQGEAELRRRHPGLRACEALWSPHTGILDSHALMQALLIDAEQVGVRFAWRTRIDRMERIGDGWRLHTPTEQVRVRQVVNAAGHGAQPLAATLTIEDTPAPKRHLVKGSYAQLRGPSPFDVLVYPVPASVSLGIHLTVDLQGRARFGPDQQWMKQWIGQETGQEAGQRVERHDYAVEPARIAHFYPAIRRYWPALPDGALQPDYAGLRVRTQGPGGPAQDFEIQTSADHGYAGLVQLFGIESPGLTSSLAIARLVADSLAETR